VDREKVYFVGKRYTLQNVMVTPKPVQKPHPPIWVAALGDEAMKRAGRLATPLLADSFQLPERLKRRVALYRETAESRGRAHKVVVFREGFVAPTREEAIRRYEAGLLSTHRYYWRHGSYYPESRRRRTSTWRGSRWSASSSARPTTASSGSRPGTARSAPTTS